MKSFGIVVDLHYQSQHFFANVSLNFSNSNYRCMRFAHVTILLSFIQRVEEYLVALKYESRHEKTGFLHMRKQRRRSVVR